MWAVYCSTWSLCFCSPSLFGDGRYWFSCQKRIFFVGIRRGSKMCLFSPKDIRGGMWCLYEYSLSLTSIITMNPYSIALIWFCSYMSNSASYLGEVLRHSSWVGSFRHAIYFGIRSSSLSLWTQYPCQGISLVNGVIEGFNRSL